MAQTKRSGSHRSRGGGRLALFEVIQAAQTQGDGHLTDAVAPLVQASAQREDAPPLPSGARNIGIGAQGQAAQARATQGSRPPDAPVAIPPARRDPTSPREQRGAPRGISAFSFAAALVAIGALVGGGVIAYQHFKSNAAQQVGSALPMPEVLDVGNDGGARARSLPTLARPRSDVQTQARSQSPNAAAVVVAEGFRRTSGLNYVLMQSYHETEESQAIATRDALLANGVGVTLERGIANWGKRVCLVGIEGFERVTENPEYQQYRRRIDEVSGKLAANRKLRPLDPQAIHWARD